MKHSHPEQSIQACLNQCLALLSQRHEHLASAVSVIQHMFERSRGFLLGHLQKEALPKPHFCRWLRRVARRRRDSSPRQLGLCIEQQANMKGPFQILAVCALLSALRPSAAYTDTTSEPVTGLKAWKALI